MDRRTFPMTSGSRLPISAPPPGEAVQEQVEKILASSGFARSERLSRFLRFAVDKKLRGEGDQIKEYLLGVEVFDRDASYDPRLDPIVRVEAARLRAKLREYYRTEGQSDPVRIEFDRGTYVPVLELRAPPAASSEPGGDSAPGTAARDWKTVAVIALAGLAVVAMVWALRLDRRNAELEARLAPGAGHALEVEFAPLWGPFFSGDAPNYVVFGSPMFFSSDRLALFVRRLNLNDPKKTSECLCPASRERSCTSRSDRPREAYERLRGRFLAGGASALESDECWNRFLRAGLAGLLELGNKTDFYHFRARGCGSSLGPERTL
jgi:hypothetical protein